MTEEVANKSIGSRRVAELDALRALAAINLMLFHFTHVYSVKYGYSSPLGWEWPYGKYGVQLFFMLSGLVNAMVLTRIGSAAEFLGRRMIRILPAYYLVIGLNLVLLTWLPLSLQGSYTWDQVLANLTVVPSL
ncbi:MAG TPA: acyltransferase family protein, partial [Pirellulaceae bacterium]|nr:acyltransferase family protein [Pirellulaceae bacterium]